MRYLVDFLAGDFFIDFLAAGFFFGDGLALIVLAGFFVVVFFAVAISLAPRSRALQAFPYD